MITLDEAREIAYAWHGGGSSPLYSFASTSNAGKPENITPDTVQEVDQDIAFCVEYVSEQKQPPLDIEPDITQLNTLRAYLIANLPAQPEEE